MSSDGPGEGERGERSWGRTWQILVISIRLTASSKAGIGQLLQKHAKISDSLERIDRITA